MDGLFVLSRGYSDSYFNTFLFMFVEKIIINKQCDKPCEVQLV